jgi:hypothetical protein
MQPVQDRRAGTQYLGNAKLSSTRCRLIGLNLSDSNHIVMELGVGYIRFWKDGALITSSGSPVEATQVDYNNTATGTTPVHPYQEADLRAVQVCQINNLAYFTHPSYPPQRLSRLSDTNWTIGEVPFGDTSIKNNWAPMLDQNITTTTITPSGTVSSGTVTAGAFLIGSTYTIATVGTTNFTLIGAASNTVGVSFVATGVGTGTGTATTTAIKLTASTGIFKAGHVGAYYELSHPNPTTYISWDINATTTPSGTIKILGKWSLQTFGTWTAVVDLQASVDNGTTWKTVRTYKSTADYNAISSGEEQVETLFRIVVSGFSTTTSSTNPRVMLSPLDPTLKGLVRITGYTSSTVVTAKVLKTLGGTGATSQWIEGAFSAVQSYPAAVALHDSRIIFAGTSSNPSSLWGSYTNDFQNFKQGAYDADSWYFTLASTTAGQIQWLVSKSSLLIGTTLDEWSMTSSDQTRPITPTNVNVRQQSHYGSSSVGAQIINDTIILFYLSYRRCKRIFMAR